MAKRKKASKFSVVRSRRSTATLTVTFGKKKFDVSYAGGNCRSVYFDKKKKYVLKVDDGEVESYSSAAGRRQNKREAAKCKKFYSTGHFPKFHAISKDGKYLLTSYVPGRHIETPWDGTARERLAALAAKFGVGDIRGDNVKRYKGKYVFIDAGMAFGHGGGIECDNPDYDDSEECSCC